MRDHHAVQRYSSSSSSSSSSSNSSSKIHGSAGMGAAGACTEHFDRFTCFRMLPMSTSRSCSLYEFVSGMLLALMHALQARGRAVGLIASKGCRVHRCMLLNRCMAATRQWLLDLYEMFRQQDPTGYSNNMAA
jgi:hypothetical protein